MTILNLKWDLDNSDVWEVKYQGMVGSIKKLLNSLLEPFLDFPPCVHGVYPATKEAFKISTQNKK